MDSSAHTKNTTDNNTQNLTPAPVNPPGAAADPLQPPTTPAIPSVSIASPPSIPEANPVNPSNQNPGISAEPAQTPNLPPLPTTSINQSSAAPEKPAKKSINFLNLLLLIGGPLFMVGSILFVFYRLGANQPETYQQESSEIMTISKLIKVDSNKKMFTNVPKNPDQVKAICQSTGKEIVSNTLTDCPDPVFEWSGAEPREPGTKIIGYYVYFDVNSNDIPIFLDSPINLLSKVINPKNNGAFQQSNIFTSSNLIKGQTYYLAINSVSDSQNNDWKMGINAADIQNLAAESGEINFIANIMFIYDYR